jgi:putative ATP-binding cassette transporter
MSEPLVGTNPQGFFAKLWRLTKPYWHSEERWMARGLLAIVVGLNLGLVYLNVLFNDWNGRFYDALQEKNLPHFWRELGIFTILAFSFIVVGVYQYYLRQMLIIRWRRWLTERYQANWLANRVYYRIELANRATDNPDQRIQEDLGNFSNQTLSLGLDAMSSVVTLFSFFLILWNLSGPLSFALAGIHVTIPGYMVWVAIIYAVVGSGLTQRIGRRLAKLFFEQQKYEADFRFTLVRLRENAEGVALYRGEADEHARLSERFGKVLGNWLAIMRLNKHLLWFTTFYSQLAIIFPFLVAAPRYFSGAITMGTLFQVSNAFGQVQSALSWFINSYTDIANWRSSVDRLTSFDQAIAEAAAAGEGGIAITPELESAVKLESLDLQLPNGAPLLSNASTDIASGERLLVSGRSGSGKSTLIRAIAGIWPYGAGKIVIPQLARMLFLPQRPYVPIGSLRNALTFPAKQGSFSDAEIMEALKACRLAERADRLDEEDHWDRRLSPGEQQRLAIARALLQKPDWLFLDEATSALDPELEAELYRLILERLPNTTLISIAHRTSLEAYHKRRLRFVPTDWGTELKSEPIVQPGT